MTPIPHRAKMRQCIYCLEEVARAKVTDDHIIAGSWYPDSTPATTQRWTAPACRRCNVGFSAAESDLLARLALCVDPRHPASAGIWERVKRSLDPASARGDRDRKHRTARRAAFIRAIEQIDSVSQHALPFSVRNFESGSRHGIKINKDQLETVVAKWARGFYAHVHGRPLSRSGSVSVIQVLDENALVAFADIEKFGRRLQAGPGIEVTYWSAEDATRREDIYAFNIWAQFRTYAGVSDIS